MPEGDTLFRAAAALRPHLLGKPAMIRMPRQGDAEHVAEIREIHVHGKQLFLVLGDGRSIYTHLKMTGVWHVYRKGERWRKAPSSAVLVVATDTHQAVCFRAPTVRWLSPTQTERARAALTGDIDVLAPNFDLARVAAMMATLTRRPIGEALLDQRIVAGIGNVYKSECLFLARVHPQDTCAEIGLLRLIELLGIAQRLMRKNVQTIDSDAPGAHNRYERTTRAGGGELGRSNLNVYRRAGLPCFVCRVPLQMIRQGRLQRSTYFCAECQRKHEPKSMPPDNTA